MAVTGITLKDQPWEQGAGPSYAIDRTYWGYVVRDLSQPLLGLVASQLLALLLGAGFVAAALSLLILPDLLNGSSDILIRLCASMVIGGTGGLLVSYAGRGIKPEMQVDTTLGEVRHVVRNRSGAATLMGRYGFDAIAGLEISVNASPEDPVALLIHQKGSNRPLSIASGHVSTMQQLKHSIERDIVVVPR